MGETVIKSGESLTITTPAGKKIVSVTSEGKVYETGWF